LEQHGDDIVLVISDIVMPVMGGTSLFEQMRRRGWDLPVVFLTGHPLGKEIDRLRDQGLVACLTKPVKLEVLAQLISVTLNE